MSWRVGLRGEARITPHIRALANRLGCCPRLTHPSPPVQLLGVLLLRPHMIHLIYENITYVSNLNLVAEQII